MINKQQINELVDETRAYLETKIISLKINLIESGSKSFASLLTAFIIGGIAIIFLFIFSFLLGIILSEVLESQILGFGVVALFYFLLLIIALIFRRPLLERPVQNNIIKTIFQHEDEN